MSNHVDLIAGARPNFMKLAPVARALSKHGILSYRVVHTGQHYDRDMNDVFFEELAIRKPDVSLECGSGSHAVQSARIMERYEESLRNGPPAATVVFGDVNSTLACSLVAAKMRIPVAHVEAGLRSFDRTMPEEINRIVTDSVSDCLLVSEPSGLVNLAREGADPARIHFVGNVMIDTLYDQLESARRLGYAHRLGLAPRGFGVVTLHRPSNVDDPGVLTRIVGLLLELSCELPLVFPLHPRTRQMLDVADLFGTLRGADSLHCVSPLSYRENLSLMADARVVLTDSGGMQEEASVLGVPCITMRSNTERPITLTLGTSRLVGNDPTDIGRAFEDVMAGRWAKGSPIPLWDGRAGERVAEILGRCYA